MHTKDLEIVHECLLLAPNQSKKSCAFTPQLFCHYPKRYTKLMDVDFPPKECFIDKFPVILVGRYIIDLHSCRPPLHTTVLTLEEKTSRCLFFNSPIPHLYLF